MSIDFNKYPFREKIRHHVAAHNYLPLDDLKIVPENYPRPITELDWLEIFENGKCPDILDIGCGKGHFLLDLAEVNKDKNFLGIEIREYPVEWINEVAVGENLLNCHAIRYSVANRLDFIMTNTIEKIFYLFPDPWPKRKHFKKRAFKESFLEDCYRVMKDDAKLYLATDLDYINDYHIEVIEKFGKFTFRQLSNRVNWDFPYTNKEKFCIRKDIEVFRLIVSKK